jgi:hypothetical protein
MANTTYNVSYMFQNRGLIFTKVICTVWHSVFYMHLYKQSCRSVAYPEIFFVGGGGGSTNSVEDRENGDLGAVAPLSGVPLNL